MSSIQLDYAIELKALQDLVISQAHAIYGYLYPRNTFSVLRSYRDKICIAQLIVYTYADSFAEFKVLIEGRDGPRDPSFYRALADLDKNMQVETNTKIPYLSVGQFWDGSNIGTS